MSEAVQDFLAKLTGRLLGPDDSFTLSSARKAQFAAWLRQNGISFDYADIDKAGITIRSVIGGQTGDAAAPAAVVPAGKSDTVKTSATLPAIAAALQVGIDMQSVDNLPVAADYRGHAFYNDNYTPRELAHCLSSGDERASLCGLWAAKEAVFKAGAALGSPKGHLRDIEIRHSVSGAPFFDDCTLSVSHEGGMAIAVCIYFGGPRS